MSMISKIKKSYINSYRTCYCRGWSQNFMKSEAGAKKKKIVSAPQHWLTGYVKDHNGYLLITQNSRLARQLTARRLLVVLLSVQGGGGAD
jgi:hypothetical protein